MTPKERAAMQRAMEALEMHAHGAGSVIHSKLAWDALREALAEQAELVPYEDMVRAVKEGVKQEPVGYFSYDEEHDIREELTGPNAPGATPLYAAPVQQIDLTVSELDAIIEKHYDDEMDLKAMILDGIAAYKEKNK